MGRQLLIIIMHISTGIILSVFGGFLFLAGLATAKPLHALIGIPIFLIGRAIIDRFSKD